MKQVLKKVFKKKSHLIYLINKICLGNKVKYEKGNKVKIERLLKKSKIEIHGKNNLINIDYIDSINNINIFIKGIIIRLVLVEMCCVRKLFCG